MFWIVTLSSTRAVESITGGMVGIFCLLACASFELDCQVGIIKAFGARENFGFSVAERDLNVKSDRIFVFLLSEKWEFFGNRFMRLSLHLKLHSYGECSTFQERRR
jgi:hypothetical protein